MVRHVVVAFALVACTGGGDTTTPNGGGSSSSTTSSSGTTGGSSSGATSSGASSGGSSSGSSGAACNGSTLTILVKNGQTSSCSHPIPAGADRDNLNVYYSPSPGVLQKLCKTDRTSCEVFKGWFFLGEEIGFCDETCAKIDEGPDSTFLVESGCPTTNCF